VVEARNVAVFIVALRNSELGDPVVLVETVDRHTVGLSTEIPAGGTDGEDPLLAAQRELLEETGYEAADWTDLGSLNALNGIAIAPHRIFLARELRQTRDATDSQQQEGISATKWVPFSELLQMIANGQVADSETVAAIALAGIYLGRFR
jgi:8-oxo-dGTP pyrophosphatase MutT (NUDIX family)